MASTTNEKGVRRRRGAHSARDERRIDELQALATEHVGRGAAVAVHPVKPIGYHVVIFTAKGDVHLLVQQPTKALALDAAIGKLSPSKPARRRRRGRATELEAS